MKSRTRQEFNPLKAQPVCQLINYSQQSQLCFMNFS